MKKGQQIRELPMRKRVLTFGWVSWVLLWFCLLAAMVVVHLSSELGSCVICMVM